MNRHRWIAVVVAIVIAAVAALVLLRPGQKPPPGPLSGAAIGGTYALTDQTGQRFTDTMLKGRFAVYYFGYTYCPDVCPLDVANLAKGLKLFTAADAARAARVQPVFVTVDPARDTPPVLKAWLAAFDPRMIGLTGSPAQIDAVRKAFRVYAQAQGVGRDYLVDHSAAIYLFGPDGKPISFVERGATPAAIAADLDRYVR